MTTRKNYNSVIFLTTLSVYLGLVLVGAPAPVLAQAALTSRFEFKNKVERKDDLDKTPDDEKVLTDYVSALEDLFRLVSDFSAKNNESLKNGKYEFDCSIIVYSGSNPTYKFGGRHLWIWGGFIPPLEKIYQTLSHTDAKDKAQVKVNLILSGDEFFLKTVLNQDLPEQAEHLRKFYDTGLSKIKIRQPANSQNNLYENTEISAENNQVFIVTRLPRGSL